MTSWLIPVTTVVAILSLIGTTFVLHKSRIYPNRPIIFTAFLYLVLFAILTILIVLASITADGAVNAITWIYATIIIPFLLVWTYYMFRPFFDKKGEIAEARRQKLETLKKERNAKKTAFKSRQKEGK